MTRHNYVDMFRDESGELRETDEFFKADGVYALVEHPEKTARSHAAH